MKRMTVLLAAALAAAVAARKRTAAPPSRRRGSSRRRSSRGRRPRAGSRSRASSSDGSRRSSPAGSRLRSRRSAPCRGRRCARERSSCGSRRGRPTRPSKARGPRSNPRRLRSRWRRRTAPASRGSPSAGPRPPWSSTGPDRTRRRRRPRSRRRRRRRGARRPIASQAALAAPFDAVVVEKMVSRETWRRRAGRSSAWPRRRDAASKPRPARRRPRSLSPATLVEIAIGGRTVTGPRRGDRRGRRSLDAEAHGPRGPAGGRRAADRLLRAPPSRRSRGAEAARARAGPSSRAAGLEIAWAVGPDGRVALRYVRTGGRAGGSVEVRSGLRPASGSSSIRPRTWRPARECRRDARSEDAPRARAPAPRASPGGWRAPSSSRS